MDDLQSNNLPHISALDISWQSNEANEMEAPNLTWLDYLPRKALKRIATFLFQGIQSAQALNFGLTSPILSEAMASAMSFKHRMTSHTFAACKWLPIFRKNILEVIIGVPDDYYCECGIAIEDHIHQDVILLQAPTLKKATVMDYQHILKAVSKSRSVTDLTIIVCGYAPSRKILDTIHSLNLTTLELECQGEVPGLCPFRGERNTLTSAALASCCKSVTSLRIRCTHREPIWSCIRHFPSLKEVTIWNEVPPLEMEHLMRMETVHICRIKGSLQVAVELGERAVSLITGKHLGVGDLSLLKACPRISLLNVHVKGDCVEELVDCVRSMPALKYLKVFWVNCETTEHNGLLDRLVNATPLLEELYLYGIQFGSTEIVKVLICMGNRLRHFGFSIWCFEDSPFDRLSGIFSAMLGHNPNLLSVRIDTEWSGWDGVIRAAPVTKREALWSAKVDMLRVYLRFRSINPQLSKNGHMHTWLIRQAWSVGLIDV